MITAKELNARMPNRPSHEVGFQSMEDILELVLPHIEDRIIKTATYGVHQTLIKREEIMKMVRLTWLTRKDIMDGTAKAMKKAGYKISIPASYSSIHIAW